MRVVATAGHVDHGKSTLLRALTGMEPDRYEEEQRRGLTIDLGFVWTTLPSGHGVAFVDVPGHHRLIRTMLAGVGAVDLCLFVVAATEGWMQQSEEHLRILELVGASGGLVALTKCDGVDEPRLAAAREDVAAHVAGSFLEGAAIVEVDGVSGRGLAALASELDGLLARTPVRTGTGRPRLWVDRSFSAKGAGVVLTGTLGGAPLAVGDELVVLDREGRAHPVRVRGLQSQGVARATASPGSRLAVNVAGVHHEEVARGAVLVRPGQWRPTVCLDATVSLLAGAPAPLTNRGALLVYFGTSEQPVRLRLLGGRTSLAPGERGTARLWLQHPVPVLPGDRFVLRDTGRDETVAGGQVLDVEPVLPTSKAQPDRDVDRVVRERGWITPDDLELLTGERRAPTIGRWVADAAAVAHAEAEVRELVAAADALGADVAGMDERLRAVVPTLDGLVVDRGRVRAAGGPDPLAGHPWLEALRASPFDPPLPDDVSRAEVRELVARGLVVESEGLWFATDAIEAARTIVVAWLAADPAGISLGQLRDALGTSRKWAAAVATALDVRGVTVRRGDVRLGGARLATPLL